MFIVLGLIFFLQMIIELKAALAAEVERKRVIENQLEELQKVVQPRDSETARLVDNYPRTHPDTSDSSIAEVPNNDRVIEELRSAILSKDNELETLRAESRLLQKKMLELESRAQEPQATEAAVDADLKEMRTAKAQIQK
jgi:uncharacterized coiled-coil protein SlyX